MLDAVQDRQGFKRHTAGFSHLFRQLMLNAEKNLEKLPKQRRHQQLLRKFSISLFIYCDALAYDFIHSKMPEALPSLRTVQRELSSKYQPIHEGEFRFKELFTHLNAYESPKVISIGEDATRVISRVEYDNETDKLVGFVLPCDNEDLPLTDSFIAVTFASIEESFRTAEVAKYAFVYMAQPLCQNVPSFCLACMGTNNKFTAEGVLKLWTYIFLECKKLGISVVSLGADGDPRELKAMQVSTQLLFYEYPITSLSPSSKIPKLVIPSEWKSWFAVKTPTTVAYIQDVVHIAVKLKSRLIKPSIVLPLGIYLAGVHHLRLVQTTFGKDQHGLRERDINHKDKQNYDAVIHMTNECVMNLLIKIPDAKGTHAYLDVVRSVIDSFLEKKLDGLSRIRKAWYADWLLLKPEYTLGNNFITNNAYMCIELNAHSLITFLLTVRDELHPESRCFVPWMLGSQSCEKIFRAARSMSSSFSTIINFGMLGLLRRLHRLHVQTCNEAEGDKTGIKYPRVEAHKKKDGHTDSTPYIVDQITNGEIGKVVNEAKEMAKKRMIDLGMAELLEKNKCWDNSSCPSAVKFEDDDDDEEDDEDDCAKVGQEDEKETSKEPILAEMLQEVHATQNPERIAKEITELEKEGIIEKNLSDRLAAVNKSSFKRITNYGTNISIFAKEASDKDIRSKTLSKTKDKGARKKHCRFVEVMQNGKKVFISKTTAVWLLQEGERVSSDRLFRVRSKQPYTCDARPERRTVSDEVPTVNKSITVGDICVFRSSKKQSWHIGRVLQFSFYLEKTKSSQQYSGVTVQLTTMNMKRIGVLCSWYSAESDVNPHLFLLEQFEKTHCFIPVYRYICTTSHGCFSEFNETAVKQDESSFVDLDQAKLDLTTAKSLKLTQAALSFINTLVINNSIKQKVQHQNGKTSDEPVIVDDASPTPLGDDCCTICGDVQLSRKDLQQILSGKKLMDNHIDAFQNLIKMHFPSVGGLQTTLLQRKSPLKCNGNEMLLQVNS